MIKAELLDRIESAFVRAEKARKDINLILVMRVVKEMLEQDVRKNAR